jgi:hypothetical protein
MALKQLYTEPTLQGVDMADHRGMMHPQNLRRSADRADPGNLKSGTHLVPIVQRDLPLMCATSQLL